MPSALPLLDIVIFNNTSPQASGLLSFPPYWNYPHDAERLCLRLRRLARERNRAGCDHVFLTAFVGTGLVFTLIRTFLGVSLNSVSLCEGECHTECLLFSSKVKYSKGPLPATLSTPGEEPVISTPQDPSGKIIALGLFDVSLRSNSCLPHCAFVAVED